MRRVVEGQPSLLLQMRQELVGLTEGCPDLREEQGAPIISRDDQSVAARTKLLDQFAFVVEAERLRPAQNRKRDAQREALVGGQSREPAVAERRGEPVLRY